MTNMSNNNGGSDRLYDLKKEFHNGRHSEKTQYKRRKRRKSRKFVILRAYFFRTLALAITVLLILGIVSIVRTCNKGGNKAEEKTMGVSKKATDETPKKEVSLYPTTDENIAQIGAEISSKAAVFVDVKSNKIIAEKNINEKMYPASLVKIMTMLAAIDNIADLNSQFTMPQHILDEMYAQGAVTVGFSAGEIITANDLMYGAILRSGGDGAIGLAEMAAGSEEEFANLMNEKAKELGLKSTSFANATGLFDRNNYTTAYDLSVILLTAVKNPICKDVLSALQYKTSKTAQHPNGILIKNGLKKSMQEIGAAGFDILGCKAGYIDESGYCIASFGEDNSGREYACITLSAESRSQAISDQIELYKKYIEGER